MRVDRRAVLALVGSGFAALLTDEAWAQTSETLESIPVSLHSRYRMLAGMNADLFARAEALGWRPSDQP